MTIRSILPVSLILSLALAGCASVNVNVNMQPDDAAQAAEAAAADAGADKDAGAADAKSGEGATADDAKPGEEPAVGIANPWREITEEEATQNYPRMFKVPDGATNAVWRILDSAADDATGKGPLIELDFDIADEYGSQQFCARYEYGTSEDEDISGMYYKWSDTDEEKLAGWGGGNMDAKFYRYVGEDEMADLCTWYDIEIGISYSLSTVAPDLDGFDIQGVVEPMYPGDEMYFAGTGPEPDLDISGCETFTQIVDRLDPGNAYVNTKLGDVDVLLVSLGAYDDTEGHYNCIDANVYCYVDDVPTYLGSVASNSTAYPIAVKDGKLYTGGHHFINKYTVTDNKLTVMENAGETFDDSGNATYYYSSEDGGDYSNIDQAVAQEAFDRLNDEMFSAEILDFDVIK